MFTPRPFTASPTRHSGVFSCSGKWRSLLFLLLLLAVTPTCPAFCQITQLPAPASSAAPTDPLNRTTPSGSILGFLQAAQSGNYTIAAQYLQMSPAHRQTEGEQLATELKAVLDSPEFMGHVGGFTQPEGTPQEGVPLGHQRIGTMSSGDEDVNLDLVRVSDPSAGKVWLISGETLARIPELYDQVEARQVEHKLPAFLVKHEIAGMPLWQWLALLLAVPVAAGAAWVVLMLLQIPLQWWSRRRGALESGSWRSAFGPAMLLVGTVAHGMFARYIGMPLLQRHYYFQIVTVSLIISGTWIFWRFVRWSIQRVRGRALAHGHVGTGSLMLLGERMVKAALFVFGVFAVFWSLGFNMSTALAGLGIGGIAIGFGAQQTIANLFGGVSVLGDEVIRVGDYCRFGDRTGTVEDIGLRSTWVRTDDRTLLAIPNGTVATINVENLSRRDKILFTTKFGLRSESKSDHVRYVLAEVRKLLYSHPMVEAASVRVRLTDIAGSSLTVELFAYILTRDYNEYAAVREDLLLRIMDIMQDSGSGLALPSQTLYVTRDVGLEKTKTDNALKKVAELRDGKKLPFPDFHQTEISSFKGSIDYPPAESALRQEEDGSGKEQ